MYEGDEEGILLILEKRIITNNLVRLRVRDAVYEDSCVCDSQEQLGEVEVGDLRPQHAPVEKIPGPRERHVSCQNRGLGHRRAS